MISGEPNEGREAGSRRSKLLPAGIIVLILGVVIEILGLLKVFTINDITRTGLVVMVIGLGIILFSLKKRSKGNSR